MEKHPLISVITVVYNDIKGVDKTIRSIIGQSCSELEYIIIDGGSDDGTLDSIRKHDKSIAHWISEPDQGIYDAMNKGLRYASGDYVLFINSGDELYNKDTLSVVLKSADDADIYYGDTMFIDEKGKELGLRSKISTRRSPEGLNANDFLKGMVVSHQSFLVKRSLTPEYDLKYTCSADIDWCIKCLKVSSRVVNSRQVISRYLVGGHSHKNMTRCWQERFEIMRNHFGICNAIYSHVLIGFRYITGKFKGRKY